MQNTGTFKNFNAERKPPPCPSALNAHIQHTLHLLHNYYHAGMDIDMDDPSIRRLSEGDNITSGEKGQSVDVRRVEMLREWLVEWGNKYRQNMLYEIPLEIYIDAPQ